MEGFKEIGGIKEDLKGTPENQMGEEVKNSPLIAIVVGKEDTRRLIALNSRRNRKKFRTKRLEK